MAILMVQLNPSATVAFSAWGIQTGIALKDVNTANCFVAHGWKEESFKAALNNGAQPDTDVGVLFGGCWT